jgi:hypothetical protein
VGASLRIGELVVLTDTGAVGEVVDTHRGGGMAKVKFTGGRVKWFKLRDDPRLRRVPTGD